LGEAEEQELGNKEEEEEERKAIKRTPKIRGEKFE
jgi:hypothetical protein